MKKLLFASILLLPPPLFAMLPDEQKEESTSIYDKAYYEKVMGSLVLVKEEKTPEGSEIKGTFRKGDQITCTKDAEGNTQATFITKKGEHIDAEVFGDSPDHLYDSLHKKAAKLLAGSQKKNN